MNTFLRRLCAGLCLAALPVFAEPAPPPPVAPVPPTEFRGWTHAFRIQNDQAEADFVPAVGRLVHFARRDGASPLRLEPALAGKTPAAGETFFNVGGDWLWPVAQSRWASFADADWPPPMVMADLPWTGTAWQDADGTQCCLMTREYGEPLHIKVSRLIKLAKDANRITIRQRIERTAASEVPVVLWNISQIAGPDTVVLPADEDSALENGVSERKPKADHSH